jgi:putative salt-induced outer membrane protein
MRIGFLFCCLAITTSTYAASGTELPKWFSAKNPKVAKPGAQSQAHAPTADLSKKSSFDGSKVAVGYVANTGNTNSRNINLGSVVNYTHERWNLNQLTTYERESTADAGVTENKFYSQGRAQYALNVRDYLYSQLSYLNNQFDGYVYVYNENLGYGHYFTMPPTMSFDVFLGPGFSQRKLIESAGGNFSNQADMQFGVEYLWDLSKTATFSSTIQTETGSENTHTDANVGVTSFITNHLALNVNYAASNDSKPVEGKKAINTTTTIQMLYNF